MKEILLLTSLISFLPALYPMKKVFKKVDLNFFDLLLLSHTLYFSFIPLKSAITGEFEYIKRIDSYDIINTSIYYTCFAIVLLFIDIYWTRKKHHTFPLNITKYIANTPPLFFNKKSLLLIIFCLALSAIFYLPNASTAIRNELEGDSRNIWAIYWGTIFNWVNALIALNLCWTIKYKKLNTNSVLLFISALVLSSFASRRDFVELILLFLLFFYSLCKKYITLKTVSIFSICIFLIYTIYFPFYNVIRWNTITFNSKAPIESFIQIIDYGIDNWGYESKNAVETSKSRELGLYSAVAHLIKNDNDFQYGSLTLKAIDYALPSAINPSKGKGTETFLEEKSKAFVDIADSVLYLSYGEFYIIGFLYAAFLFYFIGLILQKTGLIFYKKTNSHLYNIFIIISFFSIAWNIEQKLDGLIAMLFMIIIYFIIMQTLKIHKYINF